MARAAQVIWAIAGWTLLLAMPALWALSHYRGDTILWLSGGQRSLMVASNRGRLAVVSINPTGPPGYTPQLILLRDESYADICLTWDVDAGYPIHGFNSLHWSSGPPGGPFIGGATTFVLPWWLLSVPTLLLTALAARRSLRRRRWRKHGLCLACGYDLRHSPARCPECGTVVGAKGVSDGSAVSI